MSDDPQVLAGKRLSDLLALPLPSDQTESGAIGFFDPWLAFDNIIGAYDSTIDQMAIATLEALRDQKPFEIQDGEHGLFAQFFLHVLAGHDYVDYGTSPRGAFPTFNGTDVLIGPWIEKWKAWYAVYWGEPYECPNAMHQSEMPTNRA